MSVTDHSVADYMAYGRTLHHDRHGTVHDGESRSCGICNAMRMKALGAYAHRSEAAPIEPEPDAYEPPSFAAAFLVGVICLAAWTGVFFGHAVLVWLLP